MIKVKRLSPEVNMFLNMFFQNNGDCKVQEIIQIGSQNYYNNGEQIKLLSDVLNVLFTQQDVSLYGVENVSGEEWIGENWIICDKFFLQFDSELTSGSLITYPEAVQFAIDNFSLLKSQGYAMGKKNPEAFDYLIGIREDRANFSIEYQPCLPAGLTYDIMDENFLDVLPDREKIINFICSNYNLSVRKEPVHVEAFFVKEGLIRFMETGVFEAFPYVIYRPFSMKTRCEILRNVIFHMKENNDFHQRMLTEDFIDIECVRLEELIYADESKKVSLATHVIDFDAFRECRVDGKGRKDVFEIDNENIINCVEGIWEYLKSERFSYSEEETLKFMQDVLEEYEAKI